MKHLYPYILLTLFLNISTGYQNLWAKVYTSSCRIHNVDGPLDAGDVNQKVLKIVLNVGNGGGTTTRTAMSFDLTGFAEMASVKLYYKTTVNDSDFATATLGGSAVPGASVTISGFTADNGTANGDWFYWLVVDMNATITSNTIVDAIYTGSTGGGTPTFVNGAPPISPTGFRFTSRNYKIGTGEQYLTIKETANGISRFDYDGADSIFMEMTVNYANPVESGAVIQFKNHNGPANITIRPETGQSGKYTNGDPGNGIYFIEFDGIKKIIFDGRPGGIGILSEWTICNIRTTSMIGGTIRFVNGSTQNELKYMVCEGEHESGFAFIYFNTTTATTGNNDNVISDCVFRDRTDVDGTTAIPCMGILSNGTLGKPNSNNIINNCYFSDTYNGASSFNGGVYLYSNSNGWNITNNHFYQTVPYANIDNPYFLIYMADGSNYNVSDNYLGGNAPNCGGTPMSLSSGTTGKQFAAIVFAASVTGNNTINGNTIANISYYTTNTNAVDPLVLISAGGSANYTIGTSGNGNLIGSSTGTGNIVLTNDAASGSTGIRGISHSSTGTSTISENILSGITVNGSKSGATTRLINVSSGTVTVYNNTIGGTIANSIDVQSNSILTGIENSSANGITVTNNTIQNLTQSLATGTTSLTGINNTTGTLTATANTIKNISITSNASHYMIYHVPSAAATATISSNTIQDISLTNTGTTTVLYSVYVNTASAVTCNSNIIGSTTAQNISLAGDAASYGVYKAGTGTLTCNNNTIQEYYLTNSGTSSAVYGIYLGAGALSATGNTIKNFNSKGDITGIYFGVSSASNEAISNTIQNLNLTITFATSKKVDGIFVGTAVTGNKISKNLISGITTQSSSNLSEIRGIYFAAAGGWDVFNNVILLNNAPYTNDISVFGMRGSNDNVTANSFSHNTVKISGSISSGTSGSYGYYLSSTGVADVVRNNIFQNLRTGGTGSHYAEFDLNGITSTNYNYLEVAADPAKTGGYNGVNYNLAGWQGAPVNAANSVTGTITLDATGKVTTDPFSGAGKGTNLTATVPDDKDNITRGTASWMGAYEGPNITTGTISPLAYCAGGAVSVPYTVGGGGSFIAGNNFTAQLSDAAGSFAAPTTIAILGNTTTSGTIAATMPNPVANGNNYRIRVIASSPQVTGSANSNNIDIQSATPSAPGNLSATNISCSGFTANWNKTVYNNPGGTTNTCSGYFYDTGGKISGYTNNQDITTTFCSYQGDNITVDFTSFNTESGSDILYIYDGPNTSAPSLGSYSGVTSPGTKTSSGSCLTFRFTSDGITPAAGWEASISCTEVNTYYLDVATDAAFTNFITGYNSKNVGKVTTEIVNELTAGTSYYYRTRAQNGCGTSANSGAVPLSTNGDQRVLVVNSTANGTTTDGVSLRWAITESNSNCGHDSIILGFGAGADFTISLTATLPNLTDAAGTVIDGFSNYMCALTGTVATTNGTTTVTGTGTLFTTEITTGALININGYKRTVASITNNTTLSVNSIFSVTASSQKAYKECASPNNGTPNSVAVFNATAATPMNPTYKVILGNAGSPTGVVTGLVIASGSNYNKIKGLVLQNFGDGTPSTNDIAITINGNNNTILGCFIGMDVGGTTRGTKTTIGIEITGANNFIGNGTASGANLISGTNNAGYGIRFTGSGAYSNSVKGNMIGLQRDGSTLVSGSNMQSIAIFIGSAAGNSNIVGGSESGDGNVLSGNSYASFSYGVYISSTTGGNKVLGNIIGPKANGIEYVTSNLQEYGVYISGSPNNVIGGNTAAERNIISANETYGVYITGASSTGNIVKGNYIGIDKNGTTFLTGSTQDYGVYILTGAASNTIGGSVAGEGNVISGNADATSTGRGIYLVSTATAGNTVLGNIIGPQADGVTYLASNAQSRGIEINGSPNNTIGGNTTGARNIISANETYGVAINGAGSTGNLVKGNYIGIDKNGTTFITGSTQDVGVFLSSSSGGGNTIGGSGAGDGNVISGNKLDATNGYGIYLVSTDIAGNTALGNIIGPQADGVTYLASNAQYYGVNISGSPNNVIGGNIAGARNIISANETYGVYITGANSTGNVVKGNYIGIDKNGTTFITNSTQTYGVYFTTSAGNNTIGGSGSGEGNVISGNASVGLEFISSANGNTVLGNIIGPQANGTSYLPAPTAQYYGIAVSGSANSVIGGNTASARNIISANESHGVYITGAGSTGNVVKGNYIGIDKNGTTFISGSTQDYGVYITTSAASNTIGGNGVGEGNVISGNADATSTARGIYLASAAAAGNTVLGNIIGPQADGVTYLASNAQFRGIEINGSTNNTIGGNTAGARNIISANEIIGVYFTGAGSTGNVVKGNYIGTSSSLANITSSSQDYGVYIAASAATNQIGTGLANEENQIVFNTVNGVFLIDALTTGNKISANPIYSNTGKPIELNYGVNQANSGKALPVITTANATTVSGTSGASDVIEIFKNTNGICNDAVAYIGTATADAGGNWSLTGLTLVTGEFVLATARDASNNTSEFSTCVAVVCTPITYTVNSTDDVNDGLCDATHCSLREAINAANAHSCHDNIIFNLGAGGPFTIALTTALPNLTDNYGVTIDGWNNSGNNGTPNTIPVFSATTATPLNATYKIILGNTPGTIPTGIILASDSNVIKGLVLQDFGDGTVSANDIAITISGNANQVLGCYIGMNVDGITQGGIKTATGIEVSGANNKIGNGTAAGANLISGMNVFVVSPYGGGVHLTGAGSTGNTIKGNMLGLQKDGSTVVTGATQASSVFITLSAANNTTGGSVAGEGNVISGSKDNNIPSDAAGIYLNSSAAGGNTIIGNIIGTRADGITYVTSNSQKYGIYIDNSLNNTIGGNTVAARNIISANESYGVFITNAGSTGNFVKGNYIGPSSSLANITSATQDYGVYITTSAATNQIGTGLANEENQIAFNTVNGVYLIDALTTGNKISRNPIYSNTGKPINLNYGASQANSGKAVPVITTANETTVSGTSGASDVIEIFKNTNGVCNDAVAYIGTATADAGGNWSLTGLTLIAGEYALTTARDASSNTSEFSTCVTINTIAITTLSPSPTMCRGGNITVSYAITGTYNPGNIFTAQLSNAAGSFAAPTAIGNVASTTAVAITATIPSEQAMGTLYRIRVVSSTPSVTGTDNGSNLTVSGNCTFYWVGGEGNWDDPVHWSGSSGGAGGIGIPNIHIDVIIDDNSATGPNAPIHLTGPAQYYTRGFTMTGVTGSKTPLLGRGSLMPRTNWAD